MTMMAVLYRNIRPDRKTALGRNEEVVWHTSSVVSHDYDALEASLPLGWGAVCSSVDIHYSSQDPTSVAALLAIAPIGNGAYGKGLSWEGCQPSPNTLSWRKSYKDM